MKTYTVVDNFFPFYKALAVSNIFEHALAITEYAYPAMKPREEGGVVDPRLNVFGLLCPSTCQ